MAQVNVQIAGRIYRMACGDGEEDHLRSLAERLDRKIDDLRGTFGEIGDNRITVMAALTIADQLGEAERRLAGAEAERDALRHERAGRERTVEALAETLADALDQVAARIEGVTRSLNAGRRD